MKRYLLLTITCILFSLTAEAQSNRHTWKMGPLTWNDFHHNTAINEKTSYLEYFVDVTHREVNVGNIKYIIPTLEAYTCPDYSWADTSFRSPRLLAYNQCLFDLVEVHRRKLERELGQTNIWNRDEFMKKGIHRLDEDLVRAENDMKQGSDTAALSRWQIKVKHDLDSIAPFTPTRFEEGNFGLGATFGLGFKGIAGDLSKYFTNGGGMDFSFDIISKRHYFTWGTYIGWAGCKQNVWDKKFFDELGVTPPTEGRYHYPDGGSEEPLIYKGELATCLDMYWAYGYTVFNNNVHKITPFVGIGLEGFYTSDDDEVSYGRTAFSWHFGLDYNWQYSNTIDHGSFSLDQRYNCSHDVVAVNCKLYAAYDNFKTMVGMPKGFSINFQVNLGLWTGNAHYE